MRNRCFLAWDDHGRNLNVEACDFFQAAEPIDYEEEAQRNPTDSFCGQHTQHPSVYSPPPAEQPGLHAPESPDNPPLAPKSESIDHQDRYQSQRAAARAT